MSVKIKLALVVILAVSASVNGQDAIVNEEDERTVSDVETKIEDAVENVEQTNPEELESHPAEVISDTATLEVKNGKYQMSDDTLEGGVSDLTAVEFDSNDVQNERQVLNPSTTATTNTEYGE